MNPNVENSAASRLRGWIATHPVAGFLVILYPITWILFLPAVLGKSGFGVIPVDIPYQVSVLLATFLGLTSVAFLVTRIADGKEGTRALRRHYYQFRAAPQWYLGAIFGPPIVLLVADFLIHGPSVFAAIGNNFTKIPTAFLLQVLLFALLINLWEEGAWVGFMTARLQPRVGPFWASVLVAPCFGFVHFPLFFIAGGLGPDHIQPSQFLMYAFFLLIGFSVQVRILATWLFNSTGGSLPVVALFHSSMDATSSVAVLALFFQPGGDSGWLYIGFAVIAVLLVVATRGKLGYKPEPAPAADRTPLGAPLPAHAD